MLKFKKAGLLNLMADLKDSDKLTLVGDHGVYIMSFAHKVTLPEDGPRPLVYAEGCDPEADEDFYDNKHAEYGGDDGGDDIGTVGEMRKMLNMCKDCVRVKLTSTFICVESDVKHPIQGAAKPKIDPALIPAALRKYL